MRKENPSVWALAFGGTNVGFEMLDFFRPALNNGVFGATAVDRILHGISFVTHSFLSMEARFLNLIGLERFGQMLLHGTTNERLAMALGTGVTVGILLWGLGRLTSST